MKDPEGKNTDFNDITDTSHTMMAISIKIKKVY